MTRAEVQKKIDEATEAVKQYKAQGLNKADPRYPITEGQEIDKLEKSIRGMMNESYVIGAAGDRCEHCGGSGRKSA